MSPLTRAIRDELLALIRSDQELRDELRRALGGDADELLTIGAAAKVASCTPRTISRAIRAGALAATGEHKRTRISRAALQRWLTRGGRREVELDPEALADSEEVGR